MPTVKKQTTKRRKKSGAVARIAPVSFGEEKDKINIYGTSGTGKTTLACTYPKPLLIIGAEKGTRSVYNVKGVDFVRLEQVADIQELLDHVESSRKYQSVVLDTATSMQAMMITEIAGLQDATIQKSWGMASRDQWGQCALQSKELLRRFLQLAEFGICHTIVLAQERSFGAGEDSDEVLAPTIMSALTASTVGWLNPECDYIAQTFKREASESKRVKVAGKTKTVTKKTGAIEFCLRVGPHPIYTTKFRGPKGQEIPEVIVDPDYDKIQILIRGEQVEERRTSRKKKTTKRRK